MIRFLLRSSRRKQYSWVLKQSQVGTMTDGNFKKSKVFFISHFNILWWISNCELNYNLYLPSSFRKFLWDVVDFDSSVLLWHDEALMVEKDGYEAAQHQEQNRGFSGGWGCSCMWVRTVSWQFVLGLHFEYVGKHDTKCIKLAMPNLRLIVWFPKTANPILKSVSPNFVFSSLF